MEPGIEVLLVARADAHNKMALLSKRDKRTPGNPRAALHTKAETHCNGLVRRSSSPTQPRAKGQHLASPRELNRLNTNSMVVSSSSACAHPPLSSLMLPLLVRALCPTLQLFSWKPLTMRQPTESDASQNVQPTDHRSPPKVQCTSALIIYISSGAWPA